MKKIGILLNSEICDKYIIDIIRELVKNNQIYLYFLINKHTNKQPLIHKIKSTGLFRSIEILFFKIIFYFELNILSIFDSRIKEHKKKFNISEFKNTKNTLYLNPVFSSSGLFVHYSNEDLMNIELLNLDIIIRGDAPGIIKGGILNSAKDGIISFHHNDNSWNRGGPPAFWEVYLKKPATGFIIKILNEEVDGGLVLFKGNIPTKRCYIYNLVSLYNLSNLYMIKIISEYAISSELPFKKEEIISHEEQLLKLPSFLQTTLYLWKIFLYFVVFIVTKYMFPKHFRWRVAYIKTPWDKSILGKGTQIKNPKNHFFADPFVITKKNKTICYVEDYCYLKEKACISAIEIIDDKNYKILGPVIEEAFHLSFPFLFEYEKELYMIPETCEANSIRLYKNIEFPLKWEFQKNVLSNVRAVDSMVFKYNERWWLFSNIAKNKNSLEAEFITNLYAFYSDSPVSDNWMEHKLNPILVDSTIARNGGILYKDKYPPIRVRQKQGFNIYGESLSLATIKKLSPSTFEEEKIGEVKPDFFKKIKCCHHMNSDENYLVYDYC